MVIRVLVVDDDPAVRETVSAVLATDPALAPALTAADGDAALELARRHRVDVVLLDIRMPRTDGLTALEPLRRTGARVVMLTTFGEAAHVRRAVAAGADGFLLKAGDPHTLLAAVHGTARGETWLSPAVARFVADDLRALVDPAAARELAGLTPRELEAARLLAGGLSNAEIAAELRLTESTVKAYLGSAMTRTGTRNRVELAALVWRSGT